MELFVLACLISVGVTSAQYSPLPLAPEIDESLIDGTFPDGFLWGIASASYQVEGGWNEGNKSVSIWDTYVHDYSHPDSNLITDNTTGDIACNSYHNWENDIDLIKNMKAKVYRFSISWGRILPHGTTSWVNQAGIDHYTRLIDALVDNGIQPAITMYHWDLPQVLQDQGGWLAEDKMVDWFGNYSEVLFSHFGDKVKIWLTVNEPLSIAWPCYGGGERAPNDHTNPGRNPYLVGKTILHAHARAWHVYNDSFKQKQHGMVGLPLNSEYAIPKTNDTETRDACERSLQFGLGWFANPIFGEHGNWPQVMIDLIGNKSKDAGFAESRLPAWTPEQVEYVKGAADFFGINYYSSTYVANHPNPGTNESNYGTDSDVATSTDPNWPKGGPDWMRSVPFAFRNVLNWVKSTYFKNNVWPIYVFENGFGDKNGSLIDPWRSMYYRMHINQLLKATKIDKVDVRGYTAWALMDDFEWNSGYTEKFGIHYVNFSDPARPRTPKDSAKTLAQIFLNNGFASGASSARSCLAAFLTLFCTILAVAHFSL